MASYKFLYLYETQDFLLKMMHTTYKYFSSAYIPRLVSSKAGSLSFPKLFCVLQAVTT